MKNRLIFSALLMLVIFSGCNTDVLLPDEAAGIKKTAELKSIPIKVDLFAVITEERDGVAYAGNLGGTISHLGELKLENSTFLRTFFEYREGPSVYWEMFGDVTGSNGDLMHYTLWSRYYPLENKYESVVTYNGGTGRFVNVEGYCDINGYIDFTSQLLIMTGEGMISNVGSTKE